MKLNNIIYTLIIIVVFLFSGCKKENKSNLITSENYHASVDKVIQIMVNDIFSPPVASRIFAYPNVAAYEVLASHNESYKSLYDLVHDLEQIPLCFFKRKIKLPRL